MITKSRLWQLRSIAWLEGISFIVLVFIGLPLKYIWGKPWLVQNTGMIHGIFFLLYLLSIVQNKIELGWERRKTTLAIILSFVPFGTFYVAARLLPVLDAGRRN